MFRTDGGGEYESTQFADFLTQHGIVHQLSCPHTPSQNGVAERKHRHIVETTIALLHQSSIPLKYWFDALATTVFLINRMPSSSLSHKTPFEVLFHAIPDYSIFKVFGCQCFPWLKPYTAHKLQPRSIPCVFLGYHPSYKGYRCLDVSTSHIYISRHVLFYETIFPFAPSMSISTTPPAPSLSQLQTFFWSNTSLIPSANSSVGSFLVPHTSFTDSPTDVVSVSHPSLSSTPTSSPHVSCLDPLVISSSPAIPIQSLEIHIPSLPSVRSKPLPPNHSMLTRSKAKNLLSNPHCLAIFAAPSAFIEPASVQEAFQTPVWTQAMTEEFQALQAQHTWSLVPLPAGKRAIGCKWVYKLISLRRILMAV